MPRADGKKRKTLVDAEPLTTVDLPEKILGELDYRAGMVYADLADTPDEVPEYVSRGLYLVRGPPTVIKTLDEADEGENADWRVIDVPVSTAAIVQHRSASKIFVASGPFSMIHSTAKRRPGLWHGITRPMQQRIRRDRTELLKLIGDASGAADADVRMIANLCPLETIYIGE